MRFDILTIFPEMFRSYINESILKRAQEKGIVSIIIHDIRDFTTDKHHKTDDTPYGGGAGMVMKVEPIWNAVQELGISPKESSGKQKEPEENSECFESRIILLSAKGKTFLQEDAKRLAKYERIVFICGRYEGVDERVAKYVADEELSIGDYVLTGGELPALVLMDSVIRLLSGVLGNETSIETESHQEGGYLEHPHYTKPETFHGWSVPDVLLSGNHADIDRWRSEQSKKRNKEE